MEIKRGLWGEVEELVREKGVDVDVSWVGMYEKGELCVDRRRNKTD